MLAALPRRPWQKAAARAQARRQGQAQQCGQQAGLISAGREASAGRGSGVLCTDAILDRLVATSPWIAEQVERTRLDKHAFHSWSIRDVIRLERLGVLQRIPLPPAPEAEDRVKQVRSALFRRLWDRLSPYVRLLLLLTVARDRLRLIPRLLVLLLVVQSLADVRAATSRPLARLQSRL